MDDICGALIQLDLKGNITAWNTPAEQVLGYKEQEVLGTNAISAIFISENDASMMDTALSGEVYYSFESFAKNRNGELQPVAIVTSPINDDSGTVTGVTIMVSNILLI